MHLIADEVRTWLNEHPEAARSILDEWKTQPKGASVPEKRKLKDAALQSDHKLASPKKWKHDESDPSELFFEVTRIVQSSLDLKTVLPSVLGICARAAHAEKCSIFLFERDSNELLADVWESTNSRSTSDPILKSSTCIHQSVEGFINQDNQKSIFKNDLMQCDKRKIQLVCGRGITGTVVSTRKGLNINDVAKDLRFHLDSDAKAGFETKAMLCLPFFGRVNPETGEAELLGVATLINKITSQDTSVSEDAFFSNEDILQFSGILNILGMAITNSVLYKSDLKAVRESQKLIEENKVAITKSQEEARRFQTLLEFATSVYKEDDLQKLVQKIIVHARDLLNADRASVFLVDKERKEVYSSVFDSQSVSAIRFPINKGIVGYVASSGNVVNLPDAYQDARFNPSVDLSTGYRTRSMLSIPIYGPSKEIVAVASLINKMEATRPSVFGAADVEIFEAFAAFCGLALHKTLLLQETKTQKQMLSVTMELMSYHSTARPDELQNFLKNAPSSFVPAEDLRTFRFNAHQFDSDPDGLARICVQMFQDLDYLRKFEIEEEKLIRYVLTVKRNYRPVLYHNFGHAISVSHAMYLLVKLGVVGQYLTELETFSMFIAALNHDIDHRGTNNQFQKSAQTALASFYSTSTMERHHFNHSMSILSNENLNILARLNADDYRGCLQNMEEAILATDLAQFMGKKAKASELANSGKYDKNDPEHRKLLKGVILTCCDLCSMTKDFEDSMHTSNNVYNEFFLQGDQERKLGLKYSAELMDRSKMPEIPRMQVEFYSFIVIPAFEILYGFLGAPVKPLYDSVIENQNQWRKLKDSGVLYHFDKD